MNNQIKDVWKEAKLDPHPTLKERLREISVERGLKLLTRYADEIRRTFEEDLVSDGRTQNGTYTQSNDTPKQIAARLSSDEYRFYVASLVIYFDDLSNRERDRSYLLVDAQTVDRFESYCGSEESDDEHESNLRRDRFRRGHAYARLRAFLVQGIEGDSTPRLAPRERDVARAWDLLLESEDADAIESVLRNGTVSINVYRARERMKQYGMSPADAKTVNRALEKTRGIVDYNPEDTGGDQ